MSRDIPDNGNSPACLQSRPENDKPNPFQGIEQQMINLVSQTEQRKRHAPASIDCWQPISRNAKPPKKEEHGGVVGALGTIVKRLMRRHGLPGPTAVAVAESAGHNIEVRA